MLLQARSKFVGETSVLQFSYSLIENRIRAFH